jgi:hypothetical protein
MLGFLKTHPFAVAMLVALLTAALAWAYARTISKDSEEPRKVFYKTLAVALFSALTVTWLVHRKEPVMSEPFTSD